MFATRWSPQERLAYRSAFTLGRIVDEACLVIAASWFVALGTTSLVLRVPFLALAAAYVGGFLLLGLVANRFLPALVLKTMPAELRLALPLARFDAAASASAPRTYRELLRRWLLARPVA